MTYISVYQQVPFFFLVVTRGQKMAFCARIRVDETDKKWHTSAPNENYTNRSARLTKQCMRVLCVHRVKNFFHALAKKN